MPDANPNSSVDTGGGAYVGGNVDAHTFIGGDHATNMTITVWSAGLSALVATPAFCYEATLSRRETAAVPQNGV